MRGQADGHPAVVAEDQEPGAKGPNLDQCHAVQDGPHRVLADAEVEVAALVACRPGNRRRHRRSGGSSSRGQVGRAAHQPGDIPGDRIQDQAR